jgi:hypothetical protein
MGEAAHESDADGKPRGAGQEALGGEANQLAHVAHRGLAGVGLPRRQMGTIHTGKNALQA